MKKGREAGGVVLPEAKARGWAAAGGHFGHKPSRCWQVPSSTSTDSAQWSRSVSSIGTALLMQCRSSKNISDGTQGFRNTQAVALARDRRDPRVRMRAGAITAPYSCRLRHAVTVRDCVGETGCGASSLAARRIAAGTVAAAAALHAIAARGQRIRGPCRCSQPGRFPQDAVFASAPGTCTRAVRTLCAGALTATSCAAVHSRLAGHGRAECLVLVAVPVAAWCCGCRRCEGAGGVVPVMRAQ